MCRWLAYSGSPVSLEELLFKPKNSLVVQSKHSKLGATTTNGDGFGVGWYGRGDTPGVFRSTEPAWNDRNLRELSAHADSARVFAHIRASTGSAVQQTNCHPFRHGRWLWMHNGLVADFPRVKRDLVLQVDPDLYPMIEVMLEPNVVLARSRTARNAQYVNGRGMRVRVCHSGASAAQGASARARVIHMNTSGEVRTGPR